MNTKLKGECSVWAVALILIVVVVIFIIKLIVPIATCVLNGTVGPECGMDPKLGW